MVKAYIEVNIQAHFIYAVRTLNVSGATRDA